MKLIIASVLLAHTAFTAVVVVQYGGLCVFPPFRDLPTYQIFFDLAIVAGIALFLLHRDRMQKKLSAWPIVICLIGTALFGSIALLVYLLFERDRR